MMKNSLSFVVALLVIAGILTACGGGNNEGAIGTTPATPSARNGSTQEPTSGGGSWADTPIYPGATQTESGRISPPPGSGISIIEARYYETSDTPEKVENFYKAQLPTNGWQSQGWMEIGMINGVYVKNDTESLQISILPPSPGGKTVITVTRGTK